MIRHLISVLLLTVIFIILFWVFELKLEKDSSYISPLPDFLVLAKNKQATLLDLWFPFSINSLGKVYGNGFDLEKLTAKTVLVYDLSTDKVIFAKEAKVRRPMASLTKIMTAIIALENKKMDDTYNVENADLVGEDSMGLTAGEKLSMEELLYGLLLPSGNDAAETLAGNYTEGGREGFIHAMNEKVKALGLSDTHFSNPSGLQGDGEQYTTAYDLLVMTRYALDNFPVFQKTAETKYYRIGETSGHKEFNLLNETNLLETYPGVKGVKTGYTPEAGYCLVTYLDYGGHRIIGIILNSENRRMEMKQLLDQSLKSLGIQPPEYTGG